MADLKPISGFPPMKNDLLLRAVRNPLSPALSTRNCTTQRSRVESVALSIAVHVCKYSFLSNVPRSR